MKGLRSHRLLLVLSLFALAAVLATGGLWVSQRSDSGSGLLLLDTSESKGGSAPAADGFAAEPSLGTPGQSAIEPAVIVTAAQEVAVDDPAGAAATLSAKVTAAGGRISSENTSAGLDCAGPLVPESNCTSEPASVLTYRLPADQVDTVLDSAAALGSQTWRTRSASDVSTQVADVDARVASAQASLNRLNALMAKAEDLSDVVALESQIATREAELESLQAQQRTLADQTQLATVTTTFSSTAVRDSGPLAALQDGLQTLGSAAVAGLTLLAWLLPFAIVAALVALAVRWAIRRRRAAAAGSPTPQAVPGAQPARDEARVPTGQSQ